MPTIDYMGFTTKLAMDAGKIVERKFHTRIKVTEKKRQDLVTNVDKEVEQFIIKNIKKHFPDHEILAEESGALKRTSEYRWIIDPIDGTTNFVHGLHFLAVSIALEYKGEVIVAVIYNPIMKELFTAAKGKGARLNGKKIYVSKTKGLKLSLLATGFHPQYRDHNLEHFKKFTALTRGIRRCGAATLDLCYTACGIFDGYWEYGLLPWDVAAGGLIVKEAGGKVTNTDGSKFDFDKKAILATNGKIHSQMRETIDSSGVRHMSDTVKQCYTQRVIN